MQMSSFLLEAQLWSQMRTSSTPTGGYISSANNTSLSLTWKGATLSSLSLKEFPLPVVWNGKLPWQRTVYQLANLVHGPYQDGSGRPDNGLLSRGVNKIFPLVRILNAPTPSSTNSWWWKVSIRLTTSEFQDGFTQSRRYGMLRWWTLSSRV